EMLRDAWRARRGGTSAASTATEESHPSSPAAETSSHAQGA
ncbi:membrane protein insertion efficiency factor YidD, partial [Streptomyces sp. NPDC006334]